MTTATPTRHHAAAPTNGAGFTRLVKTEWTKFRTIRGWVVTILFAGGAILALGLLPMSGTCIQDTCKQPIGPEGEEVRDTFYLLHQPLTGNGTITARVSSMTGLLPAEPGTETEPDDEAAITQVGGSGMRPGLVPWAKAGLIIKDGTTRGSAYAAVMATGGHGVRMQYNYVHDQAGQPGAINKSSPRWLRLTRDGDTITGEESTDGKSWTPVGTVKLDGLPETVQVGLFATSPQYVKATGQSFGIAGDSGGPSVVQATFDNIERTGTGTEPDWTGDAVGGGGGGNGPQQVGSGHEPTSDGYALTASGDIAPAVAGAAGLGVTVTQTLLGTFAGLILVVVIGVAFVTGEYRRGMIRTTLAATPYRGSVLAAKSVVLGAVTFTVGLVSTGTVVTLGRQFLRGNGVYVHPVTALTEWRLIIGTAALLAVAAVLALAIGTMLRRSAVAITAVSGLIVLPYLLALTVLPATGAQWLLRVTPAAAFAVQQSTKQYYQVDNLYTPLNGYFPLSWWAGFGVLVLWTAAALIIATVLLRRRDV